MIAEIPAFNQKVIGLLPRRIDERSSCINDVTFKALF
jgi:hypothetical protein